MVCKKTSLVAALLLAGGACLARADNSSAQAQLDFFFSPGCSECERVQKEVFPKLEARYKDLYAITWHDLTQTETIPLLLAYQQRGHNTDNGRVSLVVDRTVFLSGYETIATGLCDRVTEALANRQAAGWTLSPPPQTDSGVAKSNAQTRIKTFTLPIVVVGGLLDGFNPCAISTLILFMSVLVIAKAHRKTRLLVGGSFIAAAFLVYTGLGLGFLFMFRRAPHFELIKKIIELILGLCMVPLAVLSLRDAFLFSKTQSPADVTLQIPKHIKAHIHAFMNSRLRVGSSIFSGLITGAGVTLLESVCTGQSYIPVLMYMLKDDGSDLYLWCLLILYNLLFVLPLAIVFVCFHRGMQIKALIQWSKRNLVVVKILLGFFFAAMALLLLWPK